MGMQLIAKGIGAGITGLSTFMGSEVKRNAQLHQASIMNQQAQVMRQQAQYVRDQGAIEARKYDLQSS